MTPRYQVWVSNMCQDDYDPPFYCDAMILLYDKDELMMFLEDSVFDPDWDWGMRGSEVRRIHDLVVAERGPQEQVTGKHRSKV